VSCKSRPHNLNQKPDLSENLKSKSFLLYSADHIATILGSPSRVSPSPIEYLLLDSRKIVNPGSSLFFALTGPRRDGIQFLPELYKKGVRNFVVSIITNASAYPEANFITVTDTLEALQALAAWHRKQFDIPVIGITGSNGKTIVKEWLYQLLQNDYNIVRSPKSYNSQTGVPLSVWQMNAQHTLAIFEAGISRPGEMKRLQTIIQPTVGVFTNIGSAHSEGFVDLREKINEKLKLFISEDLPVIYPGDNEIIKTEVSSFSLLKREWSTHKTDAWLKVESIEKKTAATTISLRTQQSSFTFEIPFIDDASIENAITCSAVLLQLGIKTETITQRMISLQPVNMRLELKKGINHCTVINDSYSADINSLSIALNFLDQQGGNNRKTVILSDFLQNSDSDEDLYKEILGSLYKHGVSRLIGIGERISHWLGHHTIGADTLSVELFASTDEYIRQFLSSQYKEEIILVKGARIFGFEKIAQLLEQKVHQTVLEINLNAIVHNVNVYRKQLQPGTRIMAMVKAFAYGSGGAEIAGILQYHKIDYLGVAYADEGVELRRTGVTLPVMVMNPEAIAFESIVDNNLEPDMYSFEMLYSFEQFLEREGLSNYPVHIELETGMNRLGFAIADAEKLADHLSASSLVRVQSVFSHLAASDEPALDSFSLHQFDLYQQAVNILKQKLGYTFIQHISNTAAIFRLRQLELDMVRLGIGMYGIDSAREHQSLLQPAATLKTTIAQLKKLKAGESVGYNRRGVVDKDSVIATVRIGYADGYSRKLGNGAGRMWVKGKTVPVIGTVCMDMTMIDVTGIEGLQAGDEVIVFGKELPIEQLAFMAGTIPYEIMTGVSQRVKRVYFEE
jgi:alanine racemase